MLHSLSTFHKKLNANLKAHLKTLSTFERIQTYVGLGVVLLMSIYFSYEWIMYNSIKALVIKQEIEDLKVRLYYIYDIDGKKYVARSPWYNERTVLRKIPRSRRWTKSAPKIIEAYPVGSYLDVSVYKKDHTYVIPNPTVHDIIQKSLE